MPLFVGALTSPRTVEIGGGKETRTPDIKLAKLALYQLSYTPAQGTENEKAKLRAAS